MTPSADAVTERARSADVVVVGAGPAGLSAAAELRRRGAGRVVVIEREREAGGIPRHCAQPGFGLRDVRRSLSGPDYARRLSEEAASAGAELLLGAQATGWRGPLELELTSPAGRSTISASAVVLATGARERPRGARLIPGTRPPGVLTTGTLAQLVQRGGRLPGRAVIDGAEHVSYAALQMLGRGGARAVAILTEQPRHQTLAAFALGGTLRHRAPLRTRTALSAIHGERRVEGVTVSDLDTGASSEIACELVVLTADWISEHELAVTAGARLDRDTRGPLIDAAGRTTVPGLFAAGNIAQGGELADVAAIAGRTVAGAVVAHLEHPSWPATIVRVVAQPPLQWILPGAIAEPTAAHPPLLLRSSVLLHDVTLEVRQAERILDRPRLVRVLPGRTAQIAGGWVAAVDPSVSPVVVAVASARRGR